MLQPAAALCSHDHEVGVELGYRREDVPPGHPRREDRFARRHPRAHLLELLVESSTGGRLERAENVGGGSAAPKFA